MFAVVEIGSFQFKVQEGDVIETNRLESEEGKSITLDKVLLLADGSEIRIGQPYLKDARVTAKVVDHHRGEKMFAHKYRKRKNSATTKGHRQYLTTLSITKITG